MDPLLEAVLRKDPEKTRRSQEVESFLSRLGAERKAKLAETTGALDLLTLHPGLKAAQALRAKSFIPAGANALAFASQFGDDMLSRALGDASVALPLLAGARGLSSQARAVRGLEELAANTGMTSVGNFAARRMGMDVGGPGTDEKAAIPVYEGVTTTGKLRQMAKRAAEKGKDLPQFSWEGKIAPARQRKLEKDMRAWIPMLGSKDPEGQLKLLDDWVKNNPFWGKYPLEKGPLLDLMPVKLRPAMNFALMNSGYGGINTGARTALGSRGEKLGTRARNEKFSEIKPFSARKFEEFMPYYMSGNLPAGWAAANPGRQPSWIARPGEELAPGQRNFLDAFAKSAGSGGAAGALGAGILGGMSFGGDDQSEDDQAAVPGWKKALRAPYRKQMDEALSRRKRIELIPEKLYPLMEPDFNKVPVADPWVQSLFKHRGGYYAHPKRGNYELLFEGWPKAGLSIQRPTKYSWLGESDAKKLKIDAYQRQNIPSIMKYVKASEDRQKILQEFDKKHKIYRESMANFPGYIGPRYEFPRMPETPWPDLETRFESNPRDLSAVSRILGAQFPEYENIGGYRVSGIRKGKAGKYQNTAGAETSVRLRKPKSEEDRLKTLVDSRRWLHELISAKGNTPAVMAVGRSAAPNPLGPVKNIFDFLGKPEDYFNLR